jgi:hypothetical protein
MMVQMSQVGAADELSEARLSDRELNRATLARQHLLARADLPPEMAVERVGALQAQYPPGPPVALWSRLNAFSMADYGLALEERRLVTGLLMRGTLHVLSASLYWSAYGVVSRQQAGAGDSGPIELAGVPGLREGLAGVCREGQMSRTDVTAWVREWMATHDRDPDDPANAGLGRLAWRVVRGSEPLLNVQSAGAWGQRAPDAYVDARAVLPAPGTEGLPLATLVRHHLRAFGPATAEDVASWIGGVRASELRRAIQALAPEMERFRDQAGRLLFDLRDAPRPGADAPAAPRFLPWFDSMLLAYAPRLRTRVLPEQYRNAVIKTSNLQVLATFLVDGMVAGTWDADLKPRAALITLRPFKRLAAADRRSLEREGEALAHFLRPNAASHGVRLSDV